MSRGWVRVGEAPWLFLWKWTFSMNTVFPVNFDFCLQEALCGIRRVTVVSSG